MTFSKRSDPRIEDRPKLVELLDQRISFSRGETAATWNLATLVCKYDVASPFNSRAKLDASGPTRTKRTVTKARINK